jgi:hypothetical protein
MKHDVFFEALTLRMNDPDFSGELPFHDDHLDGKDGKPGIFQYRVDFYTLCHTPIALMSSSSDFATE